MIARILKHCNVSVEHINQMVAVIKDLKQQQIAQDIVTRSMNDGIKKYMEKWFNDKEQRQEIEIIVNKIIIKQFEKEYQNTMKYKCQENGDGTNSSKSQYYQTLVFNADDLMCLIFQFIPLRKKFNGDLFNCSLVNSHWLYQSWNPNSIYHLCLNKLIYNTMTLNERVSQSAKLNKCDGWRQDLDGTLLSKWQRIVNVKSVRIGLYGIDEPNCQELEYLMEKISMLTSIVSIRVNINDGYVPVIKQLIYYSKESIEQYSASVI